MKNDVTFPKRCEALAGQKVWASYDREGLLYESGIEALDGTRQETTLHHALPASALEALYAGQVKKP